MCALLLFHFPPDLLAQSTAEIRGVVQDDAGGVMPGVTVRVINTQTGIERTSVSDSGGRFNFASLPVGMYRLEASLEGFRQFVTSFRLNVEDVRQVNVRLAIGEFTDAVTVSGAAVEVQTVGGTLSEIVDERRIQELPLNGRDALQLQLLLPGVVSGTGGANLTQQAPISVHGLRGIGNNYMLDGGDNNDPTIGVAAIAPNPDALEEFTVQTSNFSAEYGRNMGASINAVTKSGTNQFRGSAYEFLRNDAMDAKQFFAVEKGKLRRNHYGATLGGPLLHNRTFFFGAYEGIQERQGQTRSGVIVPTAAERTGDFSQSVRKPRDPLTGQLFPDAQIPASRFDPAAVNFLNLMVPLPNLPGGQLVYNAPLVKDGHQVMGRLDHNLTDRQRLFGRVFRDWNESVETPGLPILREKHYFDTWNAAVNHTYLVSPRLVTSTQFTWARTFNDRGPLPTGDNISYQSMGVNINTGGTIEGRDIPAQYRHVVSGYWNTNQVNYVEIDRQTFHLTQKVTYTRGAHMLKAGGEFRRTTNDRLTANCVDGCYNFNGAYSGDAFSDFLLGRVNSVQHLAPRHNESRHNSFAVYAQDDWQVGGNVTLSLGLRWEPYFPYYEAGDQAQPVFRPGRPSTVFADAPRGLLYAGDEGVPTGGMNPEWGNFAPRLSAAWSINAKTSLRAGYGVFFDEGRYFSGPASIVFTQPWGLENVLTGVQYSNPYAGQQQPFPYRAPQTQAERDAFTFFRPAAIRSLGEGYGAGFARQWNVNLQRELVGDVVLSAAYVGTQGRNLPAVRDINPAVYAPGATLGNRQARRLHPEFAGILSFDSIGESQYHGLELTANKRFSRGYTILANYSWSRAEDNTSDESYNNAQDRLDLRDNWGLSDTHVAHRLVTSFLWELPSPGGGLPRAILGGWQFNGILSASTGTPFTVSSGRDTLLSFSTARANLVGDPHLPTNRSRADQIAQYFNPGAFAVPANGTAGDTPRNFLIGPGSKSADLSLFRNFRFRNRLRLQFRAEAFNAFNYVNLNNPNSNISSAAVGRITSAGPARVMQLGLRFNF